MHTVVNHLQFNQPVAELTHLLQESADSLARLPGCEGCYFAREAEDRVAVISVWQSEAAAQAGAASFGLGRLDTLSQRLSGDQPGIGYDLAAAPPQ
jgi:hypothetical protein